MSALSVSKELLQHRVQELVRQARDHGLAQGRKQGFVEGKKQGRQEAAVAIALLVITQRWGVLDTQLQAKLRDRSFEQLHALIALLPTFRDRVDLHNWLDR